MTGTPSGTRNHPTLVLAGLLSGIKTRSVAKRAKKIRSLTLKVYYRAMRTGHQLGTMPVMGPGADFAT